MDIDVSIFNPEDKQVYNVKREGEDKFMIKADKDGTYRFCFGNTVSLLFPALCFSVITKLCNYSNAFYLLYILFVVVVGL